LKYSEEDRIKRIKLMREEHFIQIKKELEKMKQILNKDDPVMDVICQISNMLMRVYLNIYQKFRIFMKNISKNLKIRSS
jgi:hypothetical protein